MIPTPASTTPVFTGALPFQRAQGETLESFEAFMCYFDMGKGRSLKKVAAAMDVHESTVKEWSSKFGWIQRILDYRTQLFNARITAETEATKDKVLLQTQGENLRRARNSRVAEFIGTSAERLLQHHLLTNAENTKLKDILQMFIIMIKLQELAEASDSDNSLEGEKKALRLELEEAFKRIENESAPSGNTPQPGPSTNPTAT